MTCEYCFRCQDTLIGGTFVRGISGGERKRVCIGNEILLNPSLLFLDEPTSGLDSTTALRIGQILNNIAKVSNFELPTFFLFLILLSANAWFSEGLWTHLIMFHRLARQW